MNIDIHVHTRYYSTCSIIYPKDIFDKVRESNLDGIIITEHNAIWSKSEREKYKKEANEILILWGIEISCKSGLHYLVYFDINDYSFNFYENMDDFELFSNVHEIGGVVIPAHLFRYNKNKDFTDIFNSQIDGIEIKSNNIDLEGMYKSIELSKKLKITQIAGSDAHSLDIIGKYFTQFDNEILNEKDVVLAIKNDKCRPIINS